MKSQSSVDYLIVYMLSIAIIVVVVIAFSSIGIFDVCMIKKGHHNPDNFVIHDHASTHAVSPDFADTFAVVISPNENIIFKKLDVYEGETYCGSSPSSLTGIRVNKDQKITIKGQLNKMCGYKIGNCYSYDLKITYETPSGMTRTVYGNIFGSMKKIDKVFLVSDWLRTDFSGSVLRESDGDFIGSFNGSCPPVPPKDTEGMVLASGYETWNLPNGCYTSGITGEGFDNVYCQVEAPKLANGWFTAEVQTELPIMGHHLFLAGNATYNGHHDYICINDDFYFYVNNSILTMGGTAGLLNEEVIRNCEGCDRSDGWCIPPVDLTQSESYVAGGSFRIWVLVEDYCTSGGILPFWIKLV